MQGIYKITNKLNNKIYIGQASNLEERINEHKQKRFIPIDMWINMLGVENFNFEIIEECSDDEIDEKEQYYIQQYNSTNENFGYNKQISGFNNSIGEGNRRAKLTYEDIIEIRKAYANHQSQKETYKYYQNKVTLNQFQAVWQGRSWSNIMPEVFTEENKQYYICGQNKETALLTKREVLRYRKYYVNHTAKDTYNKMVSEKGEVLKLSSFQKILIGDVRPNSVYKEIPIYKKTKKCWELNDEPVSTILESEE